MVECLSAARKHSRNAARALESGKIALAKVHIEAAYYASKEDYASYSKLFEKRTYCTPEQEWKILKPIS